MRASRLPSLEQGPDCDGSHALLSGLCDRRLYPPGLGTDLKSLTVMFSALKSFTLLHQRYQLQFAEVLTDNGSEFAAPTQPATHPFERMLRELGIKHRDTRPYRPQTNGKVERFWRTLNDDLIDGTTFASLAEFRDELEQYLLYDNEVRPHQALQGQTPKQINESCQRMTEHIQG